MALFLCHRHQPFLPSWESCSIKFLLFQISLTCLSPLILLNSPSPPHLTMLKHLIFLKSSIIYFKIRLPELIIIEATFWVHGSSLYYSNYFFIWLHFPVQKVFFLILLWFGFFSVPHPIFSWQNVFILQVTTHLKARNYSVFLYSSNPMSKCKTIKITHCSLKT